MTIAFFTLFGSLIINVALGIFVFLTNPRRAPNQQFLGLSIVIGAWLVCIEQILRASDANQAAFWIRQSSSVSALVPVAFNFLRISMASSANRWTQVLRKSTPWILFSALIILLCQSNFFLRMAVLPVDAARSAAPKAVYGPGVFVFLVYYATVWAALIQRFFRNIRETDGLRRAELQFTLLGWASGILFGVVLAMIIPLFTGNFQSAQFAPLCVLLFDFSIAYGIATRRIMDVAEVLRRATAYALLTAYMVALYGITWLVTEFFLGKVLGEHSSLPHLLAALAVAFSMAPAHGHLQRFANRLFINVQPLDVSSTLQNANRILHSISTLDELLQRFADSIAEAVGTDRVTILLIEKDAYEQQHPLADDRLRLAPDDPLVANLKDYHEPLVADAIQRLRASSSLMDAGRRLAQLRAAAAIGIHSKRGLEGIMLLAPRLSGRVYGAMEQDTLQILCNQLAVALENAKLYTQVQDSKIYNDILLDNLVSGVAAVTADGLVSVFNREAQRITRLNAADVLNRPMSALPLPLARALEITFERRYGLRDQEMTISHGPGEETPVRVGSSLFLGHAGKVLGALLVFNDVTTIKKLELQVRRTDRLASLGTLAAGMAHEIKNPLVTIKTFTQLLPERYEDGDFRETFSSLIGQEVKRIDSIVNQLLKFSRPAKPNLTPTGLHEVLDNSMNLIQQQLRQKGIKLVRSYNAQNDLVQADPDQLNQAFINFFLNSIESMSGGGELSVSTDLVHSDLYSPNLWKERDGTGHIRVSIRDTGEGIPADHLTRIFDPFFTTKSHGTGLGLSVAHGIIQEHGGLIDVESELAKGTTFYILIPLLRDEVPA